MHRSNASPLGGRTNSRMFRVDETDLPGVVILTPSIHRDPRGFFLESYNQSVFSALGIRHGFVQDNHSQSVKSTLRGLHFQTRNPQAKLCRVVQGEVWDVAVDIRLDSPTFGRWTGVVLSEENFRQVYVPAGFAHGFTVLSEKAQFLYKCSSPYSAQDDRGIRWNDPQLAIDWRCSNPLLSVKDQCLPLLKDVPMGDLPPFERDGETL